MMRKPIQLEDFLQYQYPSNPMYNFDGSRLAIQWAKAEVKKNNYQQDIWIIENNKARRLTTGHQSNLICWLDNETILLTRPLPDAKPQTTALWTIKVTGGEAQPLAVLPFVASQYRLINQNHLIVSGLIDAANPDLYQASDKVRSAYFELQNSQADYRVLDEVPYYYNNVGFVNKQRTALFDVSLKPFKVKRLTKETESVDDFLVEGEKVYYTFTCPKAKLNRHGSIASVSFNSGRKTVLYGQNDYVLGNLFVMNKQLYVLASDEKEFGINETAKFYQVGKNELKLVADNPDSLGCSLGSDCTLGGGQAMQVDGQLRYSLCTRHNHTVLVISTADFKTEREYEVNGAIYSLAVKNGQVTVVGLLNNQLCEVYRLDEKQQVFKQLTHFNDHILKNKYVADYHQINYISDGWNLTGWVMLPQDYQAGKTYPAILDIHGGPRAAYGEVFYHEMQLWANRGYVVMFTNPVGGDGFGDKFADIRGKYGQVDYRGLMTFVDAVLKKYPNIDDHRVGVTGGSYGGFMTNWIIGHTDRFAVAASQRSISNWTSFRYTSDIGPWFGQDQNGAAIDTDPKAVWSLSPLAYANKAKTPTLFIHSDEDYRCPLSEGMQMMQALIMHDVPVRMVIFKGENHELSRSGKPQHRVRRLQEITDWFDKYLQPKQK